MELLVKINKKLEQRRAILNTIIQNVGIQNKISSNPTKPYRLRI